MNKREVEQYIPKAIDTIKKVMEDLQTDSKNKEISLPKEFKGYISSFGASLIQSGLFPTIAFFENENANSQSDRSKITEFIFNILDVNGSYKDKKLLDYLLENKDRKENLKEDIENIAIALKLAIRTFKIDKK